MNTTQLDAAAYQAAEQLLPHNRSKLLRTGKVTPRWLDGGSRFWYTVNTAAGKRFILVDPEAGTREPAFDHERLASALAAASGHEAGAAELPFAAIELTGDAVEFDAFDAHWRCALDTHACEKAEGHQPPGLLEISSPDHKRVAFRRGNDLWVRSQEDGREWALTSDGEADYEYGTGPDAMRPTRLLQMIGVPEMPPAGAWSPDSTRLLTHRTDQRGVRETHLVEERPDDEGAPRLLTKRYAYPGR